MAGFDIPGLNLVGDVVNTAIQESLNQKHWRQQTARQDQLLADERAYNDPSAQIDRLERAGINRTFAGQQVAGVDPGNMATGQSQESSAVPFTNTNLGENLGNNLASGIRTANDVARTKFQYEEALSRMDARKFVNHLNEVSADLKSVQIEQTKQAMEKVAVDIGNSIKNGEILDQELFQKSIDSLFHYGKRQTEYDILQKKLEEKGINVQILQEKFAQELVRTGLMDKILRSEIALNNARAGEASAHGELMKQLKENQVTQGEILKADEVVAEVNAFKASYLQKLMDDNPEIGMSEATGMAYFLSFGDDGSYSYHNLSSQKNAQNWVNAGSNAVGAASQLLGKMPRLSSTNVQAPKIPRGGKRIDLPNGYKIVDKNGRTITAHYDL